MSDLRKKLEDTDAGKTILSRFGGSLVDKAFKQLEEVFEQESQKRLESFTERVRKEVDAVGYVDSQGKSDKGFQSVAHHILDKALEAEKKGNK